MGTDLTTTQLESLLELSPGVVMMVDGEQTIRYVTPSAERILKRRPEDITDTAVEEFVHPDDERAIASAVDEFDGDATTPHVEYRFQTGSGDWRWLELQRIHPAGASLDGVIFVNRHIDERKAREQTIDRLVALNRVLRHDLRNDVHVILNWLDGLAGAVEDEVDAERPVERIRNAGRHMAELTNEAREYVTAILEGEDDTDTGELAPILEDVLERRREMFPEATFDVEETPATKVEVPAMLDSVFRNLLNNAVQHNDADQPEVTVAFEEDDEVVRVRVADNGPGMPEDMKAALTTEAGGDMDAIDTGVGLIIVKQLVEDSGGRIRVADNEPRGTVFEVALPKASEDYVGQLLGDE